MKLRRLTPTVSSVSSAKRNPPKQKNSRIPPLSNDNCLLHRRINLTHLVILLAAAGALLLPLATPGFPQTHDGYFHLVRISHIVNSLRQEMVFPSWAGSLNQSFGSIVFLYNWVLPYYAVSLLAFLGISIVTATKLVIFLSFTFAGVGTYFWLKEEVGQTSSLTASLLYLIAPYQLSNIFVRGALGEIMALAITPWAFLTVKIATTTSSLTSILIVSLSQILLILCHQPTALIVIPVLTGYWLLLINRQPSIKAFAVFPAAMLVTGLLTFWFWFPALTELPFAKLYTGTKNLYTNHFFTPDRFGTAAYVVNTLTTSLPLLRPLSPLILQLARVAYLIFSLALGIGITQLGILTLTAISLATRFPIVNNTPKATLTKFFFATTILALFLTTNLSFPLWQYIPLLSAVLFPWRLFGIATLCTAFLTAILFEGSKRKTVLAATFFAASLILYPRVLPNPSLFQKSSNEALASDQGSTDQSNLYLPRWAPLIPPKMPGNDSLKVISQKHRLIPITLLENSQTKKRFRIDTQNEGKFTTNIFFFPQWQALIDRIPTPIEPDGQGLISLRIPAGHHEIELQFLPSKVRRIASKVSQTTAIGLIILISVKTLRKKEWRQF